MGTVGDVRECTGSGGPWGCEPQILNINLPSPGWTTEFQGFRETLESHTRAVGTEAIGQAQLLLRRVGMWPESLHTVSAHEKGEKWGRGGEGEGLLQYLELKLERNRKNKRHCPRADIHVELGNNDT